MARRDEGATSTEYALLAGLIAVAIAATAAGMGQAVVDLFQGFLAGMGW